MQSEEEEEKHHQIQEDSRGARAIVNLGLGANNLIRRAYDIAQAVVEAESLRRLLEQRQEEEKQPLVLED